MLTDGRTDDRNSDDIGPGVVLHRRRIGRLLSHFHGVGALRAFLIGQGVVVFTILFLLSMTVRACAQPYPGASPGPLYRFDNGATGVIQSITGAIAQVEFFNGSGISVGPFSFIIDTNSMANAVTNSTTLEAGMVTQQIADMSDGHLEIAGGNDCRDSNQVVTTNPTFLVACELTLWDQCFSIWEDSNRYYNYSCWNRINIPTATEAGYIDVRTPQGPGAMCHTSQYPQAYNWCDNNGVSLPERRVTLPIGMDMSPEGVFQVWDDCTNNGSTADVCAIWNYVPPEVQEAPMNGHSLPVNVPQPAPEGLTGPDMNPGGYFDDSGIQNDWAGYGGQYSGGGSGGGSDPNGGECDPLTDPNQCQVPGDEPCDPLTDPDQCVEQIGADEFPELPTDTVALDGIDGGAGFLPVCCPQPVVVDIMGSSITLADFGVICANTGLIRAVLLASAGLTAIGIAMGGRR